MSLCVSVCLPGEQGEHGVKEVLNILTNEFHTSMALTGKLKTFFSLIWKLKQDGKRIGIAVLPSS